MDTSTDNDTQFLLDRSSLLEQSSLKTQLVLVSSDVLEFGIVESTDFNPDWVPGKGTVVGEWCRLPIGTIQLDLTTSIEAMHDRSIDIMKRISEAAVAGKIKLRKPKTPSDKVSKPHRTRKSPLIKAEVPDRVPQQLDEEKFNSLRAKLLSIKSSKEGVTNGKSI
jgi:hypothetical protein